MIQTLELDVEVIVPTKSREAPPGSSFDSPTFVALIGADKKQYVFATQTTSTKQASPTEYHVAFPFTPVPQNGLVGQPIAALKNVSGFGFNLSAHLDALKDEISDGPATLRVMLVVNGVPLRLRDSSAPSKMFLDRGGATENIAQYMAQIPNRYRAAIENAHGRP